MPIIWVQAPPWGLPKCEPCCCASEAIYFYSAGEYPPRAVRLRYASFFGSRFCDVGNSRCDLGGGHACGQAFALPRGISQPLALGRWYCGGLRGVVAELGLSSSVVLAG